mmetsp:Transcript_67603/g.159316  ORF Transcript_67603/g.159316 Transcript_67603/m.159316 type:complete len:319 (+) Transcript_67603:22-978(+)
MAAASAPPPPPGPDGSGFGDSAPPDKPDLPDLFEHNAVRVCIRLLVPDRSEGASKYHRRIASEIFLSFPEGESVTAGEVRDHLFEHRGAALQAALRPTEIPEDLFFYREWNQRRWDQDWAHTMMAIQTFPFFITDFGDATAQSRDLQTVIRADVLYPQQVMISESITMTHLQIVTAGRQYNPTLLQPPPDSSDYFRRLPEDVLEQIIREMLFGDPACTKRALETFPDLDRVFKSRVGTSADRMDEGKRKPCWVVCKTGDLTSYMMDGANVPKRFRGIDTLGFYLYADLIRGDRPEEPEAEEAPEPEPGVSEAPEEPEA